MLRRMYCRFRASILTSDVSFLASSRSASSLPIRRQTLPAPRAWSLFQRLLLSALPRGEHQVSQVPRRAQCVHAPLFDPGPVRCTRFFCISLLPSAQGDGVGFRATSPISGLIHAACSLAVYTSRNGSPRSRATTRFQPGTTLCWSGFGPVGSHRKVSDSDLISSSFPFPKFLLLLGVPPRQGCVNRETYRSSQAIRCSLREATRASMTWQRFSSRTPSGVLAWHDCFRWQHLRRGHRVE